MRRRFKVVSKAAHPVHAYKLGEVVTRKDSAPILDTYVYVNENGVMQRLTDDQVEEVFDTESEIV